MGGFWDSTFFLFGLDGVGVVTLVTREAPIVVVGARGVSLGCTATELWDTSTSVKVQ